ncbi:MAG: sugar ABC transporter permease, partial [Oscillospiraceae bacterium]|nr:sugar ABC transporter permease [Oscillospiraceae bacterium]
MQQAGPKGLSYHKRETRAFYILIAPFIIMLFAARIFPVGWSFVMSLTNFTGWNLQNLQFIGLDNYTRMPNDPFLVNAVKSTLIIIAFMVPMQTFISFSYALLLNHDLKGSGLYRAVFYMPAILPVVVTALMWRLMFIYNGGVLSNLLIALGLEPINWLGVTHQRNALFIMLIWSGGSGMLTYLAGLKNIPTELYEAATIDGAGAWNKFTRVTLPTITPVLFFNIVNGMVLSFQIFQQPVLLAQARGEQNLAATIPAPTNYTYVVHAFQQFFQQMRFGYGLALIWVLFIVSIIVTRLIFYSQRYWV